MTSTMTFRTFSQIKGQEKAVTFLKRVILRGKIPHAYLFTGISGVGKTTAALAFAQALNCDNPIKEESCGRCRSCRQIMNHHFPDLISIEPEDQSIKIDQIRELNRNLGFKPVSGKYRVGIIHNAETMTEEAANSFLKTLEEPPPGNILVLNAVESLDLLETIVSRCQKIPFRPLPVAIIEEWLRQEMGMDEENASLLAGLSEGSLGRAIDMKESDFLQEREDAIIHLLRLPSLSTLEALDMVLDYTGKFKKIGTNQARNKAIFDLLGLWKTWYRDLIATKLGGADRLVNLDFSGKLQSMATRLNTDHLIASFFMLGKAQKDLRSARNLDLMMENMIFTLKEFANIERA